LRDDEDQKTEERGEKDRIRVKKVPIKYPNSWKDIHRYGYEKLKRKTTKVLQIQKRKATKPSPRSHEFTRPENTGIVTG